jgi:hypothetical protein
MDIFDKYVSLLNKDLKNSLTFYTSSEYKELNKNVRHNIVLNNEYKNHYDNILDIFDGCPTVKTPITLYRGMTKVYSDFGGLISTSSSKEIAKTFTKGTCCLYIITLTPGEYGILPLSSVSEKPEEMEVLLPPGSLSVQSSVSFAKSNENMDVIYCTYIPENAIILTSSELNDMNKINLEKIKLNLSIQSWVDRILDSGIKDEIQEFCEEESELELDSCIKEQLQSLDFYEDIPQEAIDKFIKLFKNISDVIF